MVRAGRACVEALLPARVGLTSTLRVLLTLLLFPSFSRSLLSFQEFTVSEKKFNLYLFIFYIHLSSTFWTYCRSPEVSLQLP